MNGVPTLYGPHLSDSSPLTIGKRGFGVRNDSGVYSITSFLVATVHETLFPADSADVRREDSTLKRSSAAFSAKSALSAGDIFCFISDALTVQFYSWSVEHNEIYPKSGTTESTESSRRTQRCFMLLCALCGVLSLNSADSVVIVSLSDALGVQGRAWSSEHIAYSNCDL